MKEVRRLKKYSIGEFKEYCSRNGITPNLNYYNTWTIERQTEDIYSFLNNHGKQTNVLVNGYINIQKDILKHIKPIQLQLQEAMKRIISPDLYDIEIEYSEKYNKSFIFCYHQPNLMNLFELTFV